MKTINLMCLAAVFFCMIGWVCNDSVFGQSDEGSASSNGEAGLFDDGTEGALPVAAEEQDLDSDAIATDTFGRIDLHVEDLEIAKVLQLLGIQGQRSIVASKGVNGTVSADLYGVSFKEALDAVLKPNGLDYEIKGNFVYVFTQAEMEERRKANRTLKTKVWRLSYITAQDAAAFVQPLLSEDGAITASGDVAPSFDPSTSEGGAKSFASGDTLIIRDYADNLKSIIEVLEDLDRRPKQVQVEVVILQAQLSENNKFGVDLTVLADLDVSDLTNPLSGLADIADGTLSGAGENGGVIQTGVGGINPAEASDGVRVGILSDNIAAFIEAVDSVTDTTVIARPKLLVLNRQKAKLLVGNKLGFISTTQSETSVTQTVEFLDVGTVLTMRPFIGEDNYIRMELQPSLSSGEVKEVAGFAIPETSNNEITTNVIVRNGQSAILGGLFMESTITGRKQVPGLGDIPLVGAALRGHTDTVTRNELIFMVTPTIMRDEVLYTEADQMRNNVELARHGARQNLLPWSRSKLVSSHIRDAHRAMEAGDEEKALWSINMALHLNPMKVEALRLKRELTDDQIYISHDSMLQDAAERAIEEHAGDVLQQPESLNDPTVDDEEAASDEAEQVDSPTQAAIDEALEPIEGIDEEPAAETVTTVAVEEEPADVEPIDSAETVEIDDQLEDLFVEESTESTEPTDTEVAEVTEVEVVEDDAAEADQDVTIEVIDAADSPEADDAEGPAEAQEIAEESDGGRQIDMDGLIIEFDEDGSAEGESATADATEAEAKSAEVIDVNDVDVEAEQAELEEGSDSEPRLADMLKAMQDLADENDGDPTAEAGDPR